MTRGNRIGKINGKVYTKISNEKKNEFFKLVFEKLLTIKFVKYFYILFMLGSKSSRN